MTPEALKILGECLGAVAVAEGFFIYFSRTRGRILAFKFISDLLWGFNMLCLGNLTGALLNAVAMGRETVFSLREKKRFFASPFWLVFFLVVTAISPMYSLISGKESFIAILPAAGSLLAVIGFYQSKPQLIRLIGLVAQSLWLVYALLSHNLSSTVGNAVLIVSSLAGVLRAVIHAKKQQEETF